MSRWFLLVLCSSVALGQLRPHDPFDIAMQAYRDARAAGNFDQAAARREEARGILAQTPLDSPVLLNRVQNVAQLYQSAGRWAYARAVVQDALSHAADLGEAHPARIQLLNMLADYWMQDGNLLKALSYREKSVGDLESASPGAAPDESRPVSIAAGNRVAVLSAARAYPLVGRGANNSYIYQQLADLYRQLGRPDAAAKVMAKMRNRVQDDPRALASFYESQGDLDHALALYRKQTDQAAANPQAQIWDLISPLQSIASLYQRQERWEEAIAAFEAAVARLEASGKPEARNQAVGMRLNLANLQQQSGQTEAADKAYQMLLAEAAGDGKSMHIQILQAYANHLSNTRRADQGEDVLKSYLANHTNVQPWQETNVLVSLSQIARNAGRKEAADEYQRRATETQRATEVQRPPEGQLIGPDFQKAQSAAAQGDLDEAVNFALRALAAASLARDGEQVTWQVPSIAAALVRKAAPDKGEQLYQQSFSLLRTWSVDSIAPLIQELEQYARFLIGQKDRWGEVPAAIEQYRETLVTAQGAETGAMEQVIRLRIDFARARGAQTDAIQSAEDLLALEESLSGTTSAPYMRAAQTAAGVFQSSGNMDRALVLHRQIIAIADLALLANDIQRGFVRSNAAFAFANARQFDEAERLANEAVRVGEGLHPARTSMFAPQLDQIRRMKAAAESGSAPNGVTRGRWFMRAPDGLPAAITAPGVTPQVAPRTAEPTKKDGRQ